MQGLEGKLSRAIIFRALNILKTKKMIRSDKPRENGRSNKWVLNSDNLLISMPEMMEEFRKAFSILLDKSREKTIEVFYSPKTRKYDYRELRFIGQPILIYSEFTRLHNLYSTLVWPYKIRDLILLKELYSKSFATIAEIQTEIINKYEFMGNGKGIQSNLQGLMTQEFGYNELSNPTKLYLYLLNFERDGYPDEGKNVLDLLWKFAQELRPLIAQWAYIEDYIDLKKEGVNPNDWTTMVTLDAQFNPETRQAIRNHELLKKTRYPYYDKSIDVIAKKTMRPDDEKSIEKSTRMRATVANAKSLTKREAEAEYWRWSNRYLDMLSKADELNREITAAVANMAIMLNILGYSFSDSYKRIQDDHADFINKLNSLSQRRKQ